MKSKCIPTLLSFLRTCESNKGHFIWTQLHFKLGKIIVRIIQVCIQFISAPVVNTIQPPCMFPRADNSTLREPYVLSMARWASLTADIIWFNQYWFLLNIKCLLWLWCAYQCGSAISQARAAGSKSFNQSFLESNNQATRKTFCPITEGHDGNGTQGQKRLFPVIWIVCYIPGDHIQSWNL